MIWPFKRKHPLHPQTATTAVATTVLCIPGDWTIAEEIIIRIVESSNGEYIAAGGVLINAKQERHYKFEITGRDERLAEAFSYGGRISGITDQCINEIEHHKFVVYLSGETGGLKEAEHIALAGAALLNAGGLGIKVDTTGKAFEKDKWLDALENFSEGNLYDLFVIGSITDKNNQVFSCGMHNLGLKDTIVSGLEFQHAVNLIRIFGFYQIVDKPAISANEIFQPDLQSPRFRITAEPNQPYKDSSLYTNPYGMWRLTRI